ncbi:obscurin isoform X3 [Danaus plexippus]|uniref:obscurin isoform X3 n=1 Tax=Danaus plexippus TaxID=13037 RepID=UPI002AB1435F|nr:obscurin isoform X3 [Danaus plexippus]
MSFCRITGRSRGLPKPNYFPLLAPISPADAKRCCRITGKSYGLPSHHYIPVLLTTRSTKTKCKITNVSGELGPHHYSPEINYGNRKHEMLPDYRYIFPVLDGSTEAQRYLMDMLLTKQIAEEKRYVYTVDERRCSLVFSARLEAAVRDGDVRDVMLAKDSDTVLIKTKQGRSVSMDFKDFTEDVEIFEGEGPNAEVLRQREAEELEERKKKRKRAAGLSSMKKIFENKEKLEEVQEFEEIKMRQERLAKKAKLEDFKHEKHDIKTYSCDKFDLHHMRSKSSILSCSGDWKDQMQPLPESWDWDLFENQMTGEKFNSKITKLPSPIQITPHHCDSEIYEVDKNISDVSVSLDNVPCVNPLKPVKNRPSEAVINAVANLPSERLTETANIAERLLEVNKLDMLPTLENLPEVVKGIKKGKRERVAKISGLTLDIDKAKKFIPGQHINTPQGPVFVPGQTVETPLGPLFVPGLTVNTPAGPGLIPGHIIENENTCEPFFLAGQVLQTINGEEFVCGQTLKSKDDSCRFTEGQTVISEEGLKFVPGKIINNGSEELFVPGQTIMTPDGVQFIPGQTISEHDNIIFTPGQNAKINNEWQFVPGQAIHHDDELHFVPGATLSTPNGLKFVPGQTIEVNGETTFVPGITRMNKNGLEFIPGTTVDTIEGPKFIEGQIMSTDSGEKFVPGKTIVQGNGNVEFSIAKSIEDITFTESMPTGLPIDIKTCSLSEESLYVFGHMVQTTTGIEFYPGSKIPKCEGKVVPGRLVKNEENQSRFVPGMMVEGIFVPGQIVFTENGEQFVPGQVVDTVDGPKFVPGQVVNTKTGPKFVPGQTIHTIDGPRFVPGQIIETKAGPTFIPGQVISTEDEGSRFVPGQVVDTEEGPRFVPGRVIETDDQGVTFVPGQIVQTPEGLKFVAPDLIEGEEGLEFSVQSFVVTPEELKLLKVKTNPNDTTSTKGELTIDTKMLRQLSEAGMSIGRQVPTDLPAINVVLNQTKNAEALKAFVTDFGLKDDVANQLMEVITSIIEMSAHLKSEMHGNYGENGSVAENRKGRSNKKRSEIQKDNDFSGDKEHNIHQEKVKNSIAAAVLAALVTAEQFEEFNNNNSKEKYNHILKSIDTILGKAIDEDFVTAMFKVLQTEEDKETLCEEILENSSYSKVELIKIAVSSISDKKPFTEEQIIDRFAKFLSTECEVIGPAFKNITKNDTCLLQHVLSRISDSISFIKSDNEAAETLQKAIVSAVQETSSKNLETILEGSDKENLKAIIVQSAGLARVLGMNDVSKKILTALIDDSYLNNVTSDKTCMDVLKRLTVMRKLAEQTPNLHGTLEKLEKDPSLARTDPKLRDLVLESAALMIVPEEPPLMTSEDVPLSLLQPENSLAMEDFLFQRKKHRGALLIMKKGLQAVVPREASRAVLTGQVSYTVLDENGIRHFEPLHVFSALNLSQPTAHRFSMYSCPVLDDNDEDLQTFTGYCNISTNQRITKLGGYKRHSGVNIDKENSRRNSYLENTPTYKRYQSRSLTRSRSTCSRSPPKVDDVVVATSDYTATTDEEVSLKAGDIVEVLDTKAVAGGSKNANIDSNLDVEADLLDVSAAKHKLSVRPKKNHKSKLSKKSAHQERWLVRVLEDVCGGEVISRKGLVPAHVLKEERPERDQIALAARRQAVVRELIETEEEFGRDMKQVVNQYMKPLDKASTPKPVFDNRELLFSNFKQICEFHNTSLLEGVKYYAEEPRMLGRALLRMEREFDKHVAYCRDEPHAQRLLTEDPVVSRYFKALADKVGDDKGLAEHLKLPIQRINDYQLLLKELVKYSQRLGDDCTDLQKALELFLGVPTRATSNLFISSIEGYRGNIYKLGRLLTHDWFTVTCEQEREQLYVFLFKSRLLLCKVKRIGEDRSAFELKQIVKLPEVEVRDIPDSNKFELHQKAPPLVITFKAHKESIKTSWLQEIKHYATDLVALAEHAADDLQVQPPPEEFIEKPEEKRKRSDTEDHIEDIQEKKFRTEEVEVSEVLTRQQSLEVLKTKRKASTEAQTITKLSKTEETETSSISEVQEIYEAVGAGSDVTIDLGSKTLVTQSIEQESVTSQSQLSQETVIENKTLQTEHQETVSIQSEQKQISEQVSIQSDLADSENKETVITDIQKAETSTKSTVEKSPDQESSPVESQELLKSSVEATLHTTSEETSTQKSPSYNDQLPKPSEEEPNNVELSAVKSEERVVYEKQTSKVESIEVTDRVSNSSVVSTSDTESITSCVTKNEQSVTDKDSENIHRTSHEDKTNTVDKTEITSKQNSKETFTSAAVTEELKSSSQNSSLEVIGDTGQSSAKEYEETKEENYFVSNRKEDAETGRDQAVTDISHTENQKLEDKVREGSQAVTTEEENEEMSRYSRTSRLSGEYSSSTRKLSSGGRYESSTNDGGVSSYSRRESGTRSEARYEAATTVDGNSRYESKYSSSASSNLEAGSKYALESSFEVKEASKYGIESASNAGSKLDSIASKYGLGADSDARIENQSSKYSVEASYDGNSETMSKIDSIASKYGRNSITGSSKIESRSTKLNIETSLDGDSVNGESIVESKYSSLRNGDSVSQSKYSKKTVSNGSVTDEYGSTKTVKRSESHEGKPVFTKTLEGQNIEPGENVTFECELSNDDAKVTWLKDNRPLTDRLADRVERRASGAAHTLRLLHCREDDSGVYTALAETQRGTATCTAQLVVHQLTPEERRQKNALNAPYFVVALKDTEILLNTFLRFMIRVKGNPNPVVKFYREGVEIVSSSQSDRVSILRTLADSGCYELVIPDVTRADAGKYSCRAVNEYGDVECEATVTVVDDKNIFGELPPGGEGLLPKGEKPSFTWKKDGVNFDPEERFKVLLEDDEDSLALVFQHVKPEDAGLYTCVAKTSTGNISCSAELTVQGAVNYLHREPQKPELVIEHREAVVSSGGSAILELVCKGYPKPTVVFKHDGKVVEADARHKFLHEDDESMSLVIKNVCEADAGVYHISAENDLGEDTTTVNLVVKAAPRIKKKIENQSCMAGSTHEVIIEVEGTPAPELKFFKDGVEIKSSERVRIVKESEELYKIIINDCKLTDTGSYSVVATNEVNQCSDFWQWHVSSPPRVIKKIGEERICNEKETVTLTVETEADPAPTVTWYKDKVELKESTAVKMSSKGQAHSLVISSAARADSGEYSCEVRNTLGSTSDSCSVNVRRGPVFTKRLSDLTAAEGDVNVEFTVDVDAFPQPSVQWYLGDVEITEKKSVYSRVDNGSSHKLILKEVSAEMSGRYTCKVTNDLGENSCQATFTVNRKPRITKSLVDMTVDAGQTLKMEVEVEGCPEPKVKWFKDGKEVTTDARIKIERDTKRLENYHLTVTLVKEEDGGEYEVRAENEMGSVSSKSTVTVHTKEVHSRFKKENILERELEEDNQCQKQQIDFVDTEKKKTAGKKKTIAEEVEEKSLDDGSEVKVKAVVNEEIDKPISLKSQKSYTEPETIEEKSLADETDVKVKTVNCEDVEKPVKVKSQKSFTEPDKIEEKTIANESETKVKPVVIEEVDRPVPVKSQKSVTEPEIIEEKSFWDDIQNDGKVKLAEVNEPENIPRKAKKSFSEMQEAENKSIWDENHNERSKQPIVEDVIEEPDKVERGVTKPELVEKKEIEADLVSPKRKSVKKESINEEPLSADTEAPPKLKNSSMKDGHTYESLPLVYTVEASGTPKPTLRWLHDGQEVKPDDRIHVSNDGDLYKLKIDSVDMKDAGKWQCEIINDLGKETLQAELSVSPVAELRKPIFTKPLEAVSAMQRTPATLTAVCTADPLPHVSWALNGNELQPDVTLVMNQETKELDHGIKECTFSLHLPSGLHTDTGTYTLTAKNQYGVGESSARLDILLRPEVEPLKDITTVPFEEVTFITKIKANPVAEVKWSKDGYIIQPSEHYEILEDREKERFQLVVKDVRLEQAGAYTVTATNDLGETTQQAKLNVHTDKPTFVKPLQKQIVKDYEDCTLRVRCDGVPKPDVKWYLEGKPVENDDRHTVNTEVGGQVDSELEIKHFGAQDAGTYTVVASSVSGSAECSAAISLAQIPPGFSHKLDRQKEVDEGEPLELKVKVDGSPIPKAKWLKDGVELSPSDSHVQQSSQPDGTVKLYIDRATPADCGAYKLIITNPSGEHMALCAVAVNPTPRKPSFSEELEDTKVVVGQPLKMQARVMAFPAPEVKWFKDGIPLRPSQAVNFINSPGGVIGLSIDSARPEDAGVYSLVLTNKLGEAESKAQIEVGQKERKPAFIAELQPAKVIEGFPVKLEVKVLGHPPPSIKWTRDGKELIPDGQSVRVVSQPDGTHALLLSSVSPSDAGVYSVIASNDKGEMTSSAPVSVSGREDSSSPQERPQLIHGLRDISGEEGQPLVMSVPFTGNPVPKVSWTKDGKPLTPNDRVLLTCDGKRVGLEINPLEVGDSGTYSVKLENPLGEDSSDGKLTVRKVYQPPKFVQRFTDLQQLPTFDAKFPARVTGVPSPEISWYKDGVPLKTSDKYGFKRDGDACCLYVRDVTPADAGLYRCVARNREGEDSCEAALEVVDKIARKQKVEPPSFLKRLGDAEALRGLSAKFTACVTGTPDPEVEWFRNDLKLFPCERVRIEQESTGLLRLTISGVGPDDAGVYRCRISNPHGQDECQANLIYDTGLEPQSGRKPLSEQYSDFDKMKKTGVPMPLTDKPIISRMADRHLTLSWKPSIPHQPRFPVTYQVEMCTIPDGDWFTARTGLRSCACDVRNLEPFRDYRFRVRVENRFGVSDPSPYAVTHRAKLEPDPPKFVPYLQPGIDFRPETSPYFPKDFDIERPPHGSYEQAPKFLRQEQDSQYGVKGHNVDLFWFVYGYPKPKMTYFFDDQPIEAGGRYDWSYTRNGQATLFINKMLERDVGWYEAVATNEHGQARQRVRLQLAEHPAFIRRPEEVVVMTRRTARLEARVTGLPYPDIKWYKDWQPLAQSSRIKMYFIEPDTVQLVITDAILKDEGLYSVSARNVAGSVSSSAMLYVEESEHEYSQRIREYPPRIKPSSKPFGDHFDLGDELGRGVQGVVYHAAERLSGRNYAAKIMHGHSELKPFMKNELDVMNQLNDRHLVRLYQAFEHDHTLALVMELAAGGELVRDRLLRSTGYSEREVAGYMRQLLRGLKHMHDNSYAHLGLTIGELLLSHSGSDHLKICDFGLSRKIHLDKHASLSYGMPEYVAPEVARGEGVTFAADMWSTGIITYILLSGMSPFRGANDRETLTRIQEGKWQFEEEWWSRLSRESRDFISKLLVINWRDRMDVDAALNHPWLTLADKIYKDEYIISTDRLRNYYNLYREWMDNAQCRTWFRRRPLSGAFEHPSKMVYPPGIVYTPEGTPERDDVSRDRKPAEWDLKFKQWDHPDWEVSAKSESHYQNGPDTYLLQLRDTSFPVRLREYMKVACTRSPGYSLAVHDTYDPRTPIIRERRRFTDIMDEEIDDERRERINNYGTESYTIRRLRHELGTRLDSYAEAQAFMESKKDGQLPFFREKPQVLPVQEGDQAQLSCFAVGDPQPSIQWFKNDMVIAEGQRIKIITDEDGRSTLKFDPAMHHDIGYYKVVARNKVGQTVARTRIVEATYPDAPDSPTAADVSDTEVLLRWKQPKYDGNSPVVCYSLQYKKGDSVEWITVAENIDHEFFVVRDLEPDTSYQFRLSSRNRIGWSDKGIPTNLVKTKQMGSPKIEVTKAMKHLQQLTESGQEIVLDENKPVLDYETENNPLEWDTATNVAERYTFISELWRGNFSTIVKAVDKNTDSVVVAKLLENRPETEVQVQREYNCLRKLKHERISSLIAAYQIPGSPVAALVMEKLQGADVLTYLSSRHDYTEQMVATIVSQVLDGLQYLHWRGYCHLNLQPDNVVMASVRAIQVKLIDFGSAHRVTKLGTSVPQVGDLEYKAPEIINDEPAYPQTDIWSLGVLTYILLSGVSPFRGADDAETKQNISFVRYRFEHLYKEITQEATRFLMWVFKKVPLKRPSAEECPEHRWLANSDFIQRKRERAVFLGNRLKEFSDEYHERKSRATSQTDILASCGAAPRLARSNSVADELQTNTDFCTH